MYPSDVPFSSLQGKTLIKIDRSDDEMHFYTDGGEHYRMMHHQDCCESVSIEDISGDLDDLLGTPIELAEEASQDNPAEDYGTGTWTFYKLRTIKGSVDIRWYGSSNGYYSESVDFEIIPESQGNRD